MRDRLDDLEARFEGRAGKPGSKSAPIEIEDSEEEVVVVGGEGVLERDEEDEGDDEDAEGDVDPEGPGE